MVMTDFIYDGRKLSDFGCMVAYINTTPPTVISMGPELSLNVTRNPSTQRNMLIGALYDEPVTATFDIVKSDGGYFAETELNYFTGWLNQNSFLKFRPIYTDDAFPSLYYYGIFTKTDLISIGGGIAGLTITLTTDSPFGRTDDIELHICVSGENDSFEIYNDSDGQGILCPSAFTICCLQSGRLTLANSLDKFRTVIDHCEENERITMDCEHKIIESSKAHPALFNDFNYNYPRFISTKESRTNVFTCSLPCDISITYHFMRKVGIIV